MGDTIYQGGMQALLQGLLNGTPNVRFKLVMSGFTGETQEDAVNLDDITTIDEYDGVGYQELAPGDVAFAYDATDNELQMSTAGGQFNASGGTVGPSSDEAHGMLIYLYVDGTEANDIVIAFTTNGGFPWNGVNTAVTWTPDADGAIYLKAA